MQTTLDRPIVITFSPREIDIIRLIAAGYRRSEIAKKLYITPNTVKSHIKHIYEKTHADNPGPAVAISFRAGLIQ